MNDSSNKQQLTKRCALPLACVFALCISAYSSATTAREDSNDLEPVMRLLAARHHGEVSFIEQHFLSLLTRPVESSGELIYDAPDRLEKRTLEPRRESLVLENEVLTVQRGQRSRVLPLKAYPQILPFVESIRATLAGDQTALERVFNLEFSGNVQRWSLILVPRDTVLARSVTRIQIDGMRDALQRIEIKQPDGDRSLLTLRAHGGS